MKNLWKYSELDLPFPYGCDTTYLHGARWLKGMGVEDWGCGACYARNFLNETSYFGIDGSPSPWTNLVEDLVSYRSETPGIFMRHVLEHNWKWSKILDNAISSFQRRMVLIIFTPFGQMTAPMPGTRNENGVPDISFLESDLTDRFGGSVWFSTNYTTKTQYSRERIFYLQKIKEG